MGAGEPQGLPALEANRPRYVLPSAVHWLCDVGQVNLLRQFLTPQTFFRWGLEIYKNYITVYYEPGLAKPL